MWGTSGVNKQENKKAYLNIAHRVFTYGNSEKVNSRELTPTLL